MGALATQTQRYYETHLPHLHANLPDPTAYFLELEARAQEMIQLLTDQIAGPDRPDETYQDKLGRLTAAQHAATEKVMREFLLAPLSDPGETTPQPQVR
mgnify:CR=1 FL=1